MLGYANGSRDIERHCKHAELFRGTEAVGLELNPRGQYIIPESDLYRLIMRSELREAERFQDWVTEEVLPQIRKTGGYVPVSPEMSDAEIMARADRVIGTTKGILSISTPFRMPCGPFSRHEPCLAWSESRIDRAKVWKDQGDWDMIFRVSSRPARFFLSPVVTLRYAGLQYTALKLCSFWRASKKLRARNMHANESSDKKRLAVFPQTQVPKRGLEPRQPYGH